MTEEQVSELVQKDVTEVLKLAIEFRKMLISGLSYEKIVDLLMEDRRVYVNKNIAKDEIELNLSKYNTEDIDFTSNSDLVNEITSLYCKENEVSSIDTNIKSRKDFDNKKYALRLAYEMLYEKENTTLD